MEQAAFIWCAWCDQPVEEEPTIVSGLAYHWLCLKKRRDERQQVQRSTQQRASRSLLRRQSPDQPRSA